MKKEYEVTTSQKVNLETARISWEELQRFFAQGLMIVVDPSQDLVHVAADFIDDNSETIAEMRNSGSIRKANDEDARKWQSERREFWAVVAAPWVLVQESA